MSTPKTSQVHLPNLLPSLLRTYVPLLVGYLASLPLVTRLEDLFGVPESDRNAWVARGLTVAITALYYLVARVIEAYWPTIGSVFVSLGIAKAPTYAPVDPATGVHTITDLPPAPQEAEAVLEDAELADDGATGPGAVSIAPAPDQ